jgi:hypothetical protein
MNHNEYNNEEQVIDVPYYTRDLCSENKFRLGRRNIKSENIINYRRNISEVNVDDKFFFTEKLNQIVINSVKLIK